jgi:DNA repair exonuclease SbcCD ATPase subunit/DNA repair exonuclease SbcCD nuclease subunit
MLGIKGVANKSKEQLADIIREYKELKNTRVISDPQNEKTITTIYHSADIHIRVLERHDEYREVFDKVCEYFKAIPGTKEDSVFVICGDIFHDRSKLTPECILLFKEFIDNLTELIDVVIIAGNHDVFAHGDRENIISGITEVKEFENFHYLKQSGIYKYHNIDFAVSSLLDNKIVKIDTLLEANKDLELPENYRSVALYHGPVNGAKLDNGTLYPEGMDTVNLKTFQGFDLTLLGDIHLRQFLNKEKTVAYPGSLIQQNHGEEKEHGILKWDLTTNTSEFIKIENDYGYITLDVKDNKVPELDFPKKSRVRIRHPYEEELDFETIKKKIEEKTVILSISKEILQDPLISPEKALENGEISVGNAGKTDTSVFKGLISKFSKDTQNELLSIHSQFSEEYSKQTVSNDTCPWKIKSMEFKNIFVYGGDILNRIDFDKGITGILGTNASGKTSLMNTLLYCLFGSVFKTKSFNNRNVIHRGSKTFKVKLEISCGEYIYFIEKNGKNKTRKGGSIGMEETIIFTRIDKENEMINLSGANKIDTERVIYDTLGLTTKDNFILTNVLSNALYVSVLNMTSSEISKILGELFNMEKYKDIHGKITKKVKEFAEKTRDCSRDFERISRENSAEVKEDEIKSLEETSIETKNAVECLEKELNYIARKEALLEIDNHQEVSEEILEKEEELRAFTMDTVINPQLLDYDLSSLGKENIKLKCSKAEYNVDWQEETITKLQNHIMITEATNTQPQSPHFKKEYELAVKQLSEELTAQEFIDDLKEVKQDGEYYPLDENLYLDLLDFLESLNSVSGETLKNKLIVQDYQEFTKKLWKYNDTVKQINHSKEDLNALLFSKKQDISTAIKVLQYKETLEKIHRHRQSKENRATLCQLNSQKENVKKTKKKLQQTLKEITEKLTMLKYRQEKFFANQEQLVLLEKEMKQHSAKENLYKYYKDLTSDKALPKLLLKEKLQKVEKSASILCYKLVGLTVSLDTLDGDEETKYEITCKKGNSVIGTDCISGFERFCVNVALKLALDKHKCKSGARLFLIDEALDCISQENIYKVDALFTELKKYYSTVLVISHNEDLKSKIDHRINISVGDTFSSIAK